MDHHGLYQAVGRIEGSLAQFREESHGQFSRIARQLDAGHSVMHRHDSRLTVLEQARAAQAPPPQAQAQEPSRLAAVAEILKAIAPAGGWGPWLLLAVLALTGNYKPDLVRDYVLGLPPAASSAPASP